MVTQLPSPLLMFQIIYKVFNAFLDLGVHNHHTCQNAVFLMSVGTIPAPHNRGKTSFWHFWHRHLPCMTSIDLGVLFQFGLTWRGFREFQAKPHQWARPPPPTTWTGSFRPPAGPTSSNISSCSSQRLVLTSTAISQSESSPAFSFSLSTLEPSLK